MRLFGHWRPTVTGSILRQANMTSRSGRNSTTRSLVGICRGSGPLLVSSRRRHRPPPLKDCATDQRFHVTVPCEPPLDCDVLEKPCTVLLLEDLWRYPNSIHHPHNFNDLNTVSSSYSSWRPYFESHVPSTYGMAYATLTLDNRKRTTTTTTTTTNARSTMMNERVEEMKTDLSSRFHDAVLVARGPIASWTALLYLESLPLTGLVCVDPIPFDAPQREELGGATTTRSTSLLLDTSSNDPIVSQLIHEILSEDARKLKLEPNAVPMLILHSIGREDNIINNKEEEEERRRLCEIVALRHGDPNGPFGEVEIRECSPDDPKFAMQVINEWIETIL